MSPRAGRGDFVTKGMRRWFRLACASCLLTIGCVTASTRHLRLEDGCTRGQPADCTALAFAYQSEEGIGPDLHRATTLFRKACHLGDGRACVQIWAIYDVEEAFASQKEYAAEYLHRACDLRDRDGCSLLVHSYRGNRESRSTAAAAIEREQQMCDAGHGIACCDLAHWTASGVEGLIDLNVDEARVFAHRSCELGFAGGCHVVAALSHPKPTPAEEDDIREAVFRAHIPSGPDQFGVQSLFYCLALGTEAAPLGDDAPAAFMRRFADDERVKPRSWCVANRTGARLSVGPVDSSPRSYLKERFVRLWVLILSAEGYSSSQCTGAKQVDRGWIEDLHGASQCGEPVIPTADLTEDRHRIASVAGAFADAWNRRDFGALADLHAQRTEQDRNVLAVSLQHRLARRMTGTHLDREVQAIEFRNSPGLRAVVHLVAHGTPEQMETNGPLKPWDQEGTHARVEVSMSKATSYWEPGDWTISWFHPPWEVFSLSH